MTSVAPLSSAGRRAKLQEAAKSDDAGGGGELNCCQKCTKKFQRAILGRLERFFNWYGGKVARYERTDVTTTVVCGRVFVIENNVVFIGSFAFYKTGQSLH